MLLALTLLACAPKPVAAAAAVPVAEVIAPQPFTPDEIRAAMVVGTVIDLAMDRPGEARVVQHWVVTAATPDTCTIASKVLNADGTLIEDEGEGTDTWVGLGQHAAFPASQTTRTESRITVGAGTFDTWLYVVRTQGEKGEPLVKTMHFSKTLPGPPVMMTVAAEDGTEVLRMEMVVRTSP